MKRFCLLLCLLIISSCLCSCGGSGAELLDFMDPNFETVVDCDGKTFNLATPGPSEWYWEPEYEGVPSVVMDRMMARYSEAEEKFNMTFSADYLDHANMTVLFATGEDIPEMLYVSSCYAYDVYKMGLLASLDSIDTIDMNDIKWGDHDYIQFGKYDGRFYGFLPWHWQFVPQYCGAVMFNGEMLREYGGTDPYEMQENGSWTWDNWTAELRKFAGVDDSGIQRWGALLSTRFAARGAILSNGGSIVDVDESGNYTYKLNSPESVAALEFLAGLVAEGLANDRDLVKDCDLSPFTGDKLAPYFIGESFYGTVFGGDTGIFRYYASSYLDYYGFVPFPTGPNGDPEKDVGGYMYRNGLLLYVTNLADIETDNIGSVMDYIFNPLDDSPEMAWKEYLDTTIFSETNHERCLNNFVNIIDHIGYDHSAQMSDSTYGSIDRALEQIVSGSVGAAEGASAIAGIVMSDFD